MSKYNCLKKYQQVPGTRFHFSEILFYKKHTYAGPTRGEQLGIHPRGPGGPWRTPI